MSIVFSTLFIVAGALIALKRNTFTIHYAGANVSGKYDMKCFPWITTEVVSKERDRLEKVFGNGVYVVFVESSLIGKCWDCTRG